MKTFEPQLADCPLCTACLLLTKKGTFRRHGAAYRGTPGGCRASGKTPGEAQAMKAEQDAVALRARLGLNF